MSRAKAVVIDAWSWLNYKPIYGSDHGMPYRRAFPEARASWVPADDERRLAAASAWEEMRTLIGQLRDVLPLQDAQEAYQQTSATDPQMTSTQTAKAWGRATAAEHLGGGRVAELQTSVCRWGAGRCTPCR
jgi:hypothetical protein